MDHPRLSKADAEKLLLEHYPKVAAPLLTALVDLLVEARRESGDDLDKALVMWVIVLRTFLSPSFAGLSAEAVLSGKAGPLPALGTNVRSIAQSTGVATETVRRKVNELIDGGWVVRNDGLLSVTPEAIPWLAEVRAKVIRLAAVAHATIETAAQAA